MNKFIGDKEKSHRQYLELVHECSHLFEGRIANREITCGYTLASWALSVKPAKK